jgi:serine/threonine protein kinase
VTRRLGSSTFGDEVFEAEAPGGRVVVVRRLRALDDEANRRGLQELEPWRALNHPYLLQLLASWVEDGRLHVAMERADDSLADRFRQCRAAGLPGIPRGELLPYLAEAAEALDYLHANHVIHRGVKPSNLLRLQGHAKVDDFDLARLLQDDMGTATFCGTPVYMAPEVWSGKVSTHTDQYSLALTYVEVGTGRRVFEGSLPDLMKKHCRDEPDLDALPRRERKAVARALAKQPADRYPSCSAFVQELRKATR